MFFSRIDVLNDFWWFIIKMNQKNCQIFHKIIENKLSNENKNSLKNNLKSRKNFYQKFRTPNDMINFVWINQLQILRWGKRCYKHEAIHFREEKMKKIFWTEIINKDF